MTSDLSTERVVCLQFHLGGDRNFHYLLGDPGTRRAAAVDPGFEPEQFAAIAGEHDLTVAAILITHGHGDHTGGAAALARLTGAPVLAGRADAVPGARVLADGQVVTVGDLAITALATPGHAADHFCFHAAPFLVTGDLLFCGKVGGTGSYFPGSSAGAGVGLRCSGSCNFPTPRASFRATTTSGAGAPCPIRPSGTSGRTTRSSRGISRPSAT